MGIFRAADANGDGVVTRDEYLAAVDARFARMDANGDGVLQASERPMRAVNGAAPAASPAGMGAAGPAQMGRDITRAQYRPMALRRFTRLDTNGDGKIDAAEMQAGAMMGRFNAAGADGGALTPPQGQ